MSWVSDTLDRARRLMRPREDIHRPMSPLGAVQLAIVETIEEAARRACTCMHYDGTHSRGCKARNILVMLEDQ